MKILISILLVVFSKPLWMFSAVSNVTVFLEKFNRAIATMKASSDIDQIISRYTQ